MEEMLERRTPIGSDNAIPVLVKWLKYLIVIQFINLAVSILSMPALIPGSDLLGKLIMLINYGTAVCVIVILFQLSAVNEHYRKAFIAAVISAVGTVSERIPVGPKLALVASLVSLAGTVAGLVADYQEYHGHSEVAKTAGDLNLSQRWKSLFVWQVVVGLVISAITVFSVGIGAAAEAEMTRLVAILVCVAMIPGLFLQVVYLRYLKKTLALVE